MAEDAHPDTMRLVTHNMLRCNAKGVTQGYPLVIDAQSVESVESEFDGATVRSLLKRIDFAALKSASANLSLGEELVEGAVLPLSDEVVESEAFLRAVHRLLFDVHVLEGALVCPESGRRFPVKDGIPNMLLHEDEV